MCKRLIHLLPFVLVSCLALTGVASAADTSLVGWWKLDETSGTTAADSSGNNNTGTLMGTPQWVAGQIGGALQFNGTGDYVECGNGASLNVTSQVTLSARINPNTAGNGQHQHFLTKGDTCYALKHNTGNFMEFNVYDGTWYTARGPAVTAATFNGSWHHVAGTYDGTLLRIYIDGVLQPTFGAESHVGQVGASSVSVTIARDNTNSGRYFNGLIDDARIYNRALSDAEILVVMKGVENPGSASVLSPKDKATDVPRDIALEWLPGEYPGTHDVYIGTSYDDVNNANRTSPLLVSKGQAPSTYTPAALLDFGQTYFWRVDEVNSTDAFIHKGLTWSFTAESYGYPIDYPAHLVKATASSQSNVLTGPEKTIDGSGITGDQHSTSSSQMWLSKKNISPIWIQYEFASPYKLHQMWVWNQNQISEPDNGVGAMEVMIETSTDGTTWTALEGVPEFAPGPGEDTYVHNTTVDFHGVLAKFVKLTIKSNFGGLKQAGLSEVRFFYVPVKAFGPTPASGTTGVAVDAVLNWRPGRTAASHDVYLGTDPNALSKAGNVTDHRYNLTSAGAEYDRTYYWKVDEVNGADVWAGDVWSFSTPGYAVVDDFESYNDTCKRVFYTWADGYGATTAAECGGVTIPGNGSGSTVGNASAPYAERTLIHGGSQSMPMTYDNASATSFSEATRTFAVPQDWVQGGIKTLVLYFRGVSDNSAGQFYVKINNNKVVYNGKADVLTSSLWRQWNVDLTTVGGNLRSVTSLVIGVSGSGRGVVYVDDLRLYRSAPAVVVPVDPGTTGLSAYYMMDGDMKDSSGKGYNGTLVEDPIFVDSKAGFGKALQFDGTNDHVVLPIGSLVSSLNSATLASWVNFTTASTGSWVRIFDFGTGVTSGNPLNYMFLSPRQGTTGTMRFAIRQTTSTGESGVNSPMNLSVDWHHVAVVIDGSAMTLGLYLDGDVVASGTTVVLPKDLGATDQNWLGRSQWSGDGYYQGLIDDFRIYNRAMSAGEVRYLAGDR